MITDTYMDTYMNNISYTPGNTFISRRFRDEMGYECGLAKRFNSSTGEMYKRKTMTCQWSKNWTPDTDLDPCVWIACPFVPEPPASTKLQIHNWDGGRVHGSLFHRFLLLFF